MGLGYCRRLFDRFDSKTDTIFQIAEPLAVGAPDTDVLRTAASGDEQPDVFLVSAVANPPVPECFGLQTLGNLFKNHRVPDSGRSTDRVLADQIAVRFFDLNMQDGIVEAEDPVSTPEYPLRENQRIFRDDHVAVEKQNTAGTPLKACPQQGDTICIAADIGSLPMISHGNGTPFTSSAMSYSVLQSSPTMTRQSPSPSA
ncbi:MAG: hypothetical protein GY789_25040 [Hyphomicrobiales bacterium]|nr:hypothetical protein [Hyphomicrobiales bacterium]MCP5000916.1 hypothetical protein [Hyphomicrobiales bacterium]